MLNHVGSVNSVLPEVDTNPVVVIGDSNIDLYITDDDLTLNSTGEPYLVSGRLAIAQDIKHMIRETGYVVRMIGERSSDLRQHYMKLIEIEMEEDRRLTPGTAKVTELSINTLTVTANTVEYGPLNIGVTYG
ncbi:hypothetical protein Patl_0713 [Paraglaciecola sp. T6c]|uniref:DUF2590 family protein n=1 Tax=Pseudoalteromonas atlantica (strain T6c / ATCC BAA-1087) TaxID=3042615 RepID=UPI00005C5B87|nr:DUF2590 family protein [Paraglaciecola sp. T6c]ABG39241.1 hypothetical protein Patl_0713 [Paraglaciecola sp. T6c]